MRRRANSPERRTKLTTMAVSPDTDDDVREIRLLLKQVFSTEAAIEQWLNTPDRKCDWKAPRELLQTKADAARLKHLVLQMVHGIPP